MDDAAVSAAISVELIKDPEISVFMINVDTKDGVFTLKGQYLHKLCETAQAQSHDLLTAFNQLIIE